MLVDHLYSAIASLPVFRGRRRILRALYPFVRFAKTPYGPYVAARPEDQTNRFTVTAAYGFELAEMIRELPRDSVFIDIGANTGIYSLIAAQSLSEGRVFAFEPNPSVFADLVANLKRNGARNVEAFNAGLGAETAVARLALDPSHSGRARITREGDGIEVMIANPALFDFPARCLGRSSLCKIDVEGAELQVLNALDAAGALAALDALYVEINPRNLGAFGAEPPEIYEMMSANGFRADTDRRGGDHYDEIFRRLG